MGLTYIKDRLKLIGLSLVCLIIFISIFLLYGIAIEPIIYASLLCAIVLFITMLFDFIKYQTIHQQLERLQQEIDIHLATCPISRNLIEQDYQQILQKLNEQRLGIQNQCDQKQTEMMDYYTLWAHQIKTPIAAMRLLLQTERTPSNKELSDQLFKIEQYVEMVLGYLKIEDRSSDLVFQHYLLSDLVKQAIRKYANQFIRKNIKLELAPMEVTVLTDEKWLVFVLEQLLSNALKYTNQGTISIYLDPHQPKTLIIQDSGIGIASEDLPRIFERGYTGYNGRMDKKATGIGLYLCQKILTKLSHQIKITSQINLGTKVMINLERNDTMYE